MVLRIPFILLWGACPVYVAGFVRLTLQGGWSSPCFRALSALLWWLLGQVRLPPSEIWQSEKFMNCGLVRVTPVWVIFCFCAARPRAHTVGRR